MPKFFHQLKAAAGGGVKHPSMPTPYLELMNVWPDGTWTKLMDRWDANEWDRTARTFLREVFLYEELNRIEVVFGSVGGLAGQAHLIPPGWRPFEPAIKALAQRQSDMWEPEFVHYVVGRLAELGRLRGARPRMAAPARP